MALYNTVHFLEFVLDLGGCEKIPGGMSGGVSGCVNAVCKWNMQPFGISKTMFLIKTRSDAVSLSSTLSQERLTCIVFLSAL